MKKWFEGSGACCLLACAVLALGTGCPGNTEPHVHMDGGTDGGDHMDGGSDAQVVQVSATGHDRFYGVTYDSQSNIYAVGQTSDSTDSTADIKTVVAKFDSKGMLDTSFGTNGFAINNVAVGTNGELFRGIVVQSTGKIVVAGAVEHEGAADPRDRDIAVLRLNADGTRDATFGTNGVVLLDLSAGVVDGNRYLADSAWDIALYPDTDKMVISGGMVRADGLDTDFALVRLNADGTRDTSFGDNGVFHLDTLDENSASNNASPRGLLILPGTQGIIGAGYQPKVGADTKPVVYRVTDTGQLDTTFGTNGVFSEAPLAEQTETYSITMQTSGNDYKLVTTGYGRELDDQTTDFVSLRIDSTGHTDPSYGTNGLVQMDIGGYGDNSRKILALPDNRLLLVGGGRPTENNVDGVVAILAPNGQPDTTFSPSGFKTIDLGGPADFIWSVALSPDHMTAAMVGIKGVGNNPAAGANDDAVLYLMSL